jgi:Holliday junction DNA helicase RuvA
MIRTISGTVQTIAEQEVTIDIGFLALTLQVPTVGHFQIGSPVTLTTYLHWNQEQGPSLFGFTNELERSVFLLVISCSGIGPKIALAALGQLGAENLLHALRSSNEKVLSQVSGIGTKKAEQMIAHLRHKADTLAKQHTITTTTAQITQWNDVTQALASLNYTRAEITNTMHHLSQKVPDTSLPFDQLMRHALSFLAKKA